MTVRTFLTVTDEHLKADVIFNSNENHWKSIRGEVKEWVHKNWEKWMKEQPSWLDEHIKARMERTDMIPTELEVRILAEVKDKGGQDKDGRVSLGVTQEIFRSESFAKGKGKRRNSIWALLPFVQSSTKATPVAGGNEEDLSRAISSQFNGLR